MSLKYFKSIGLSLLMMSFTVLISCKKDNDELKKQIADLTARVTNIESQLVQINKDLVTLQQQGKLNTDEVLALKSLTTNLSTITSDIKNNTSLNSKEIEDLKASLQLAATTVQVNNIKQTISQLDSLVNSNYLEQQAIEQNTTKLNKIISQLATDLEKLKNEGKVTLDRPINLKVTKGDFGNRIIVTWTPLPTAKNYQLFRFNYTSGQYDMIKEGADTTFTDLSAFEAYKKMFYKVKIVNSPSEISDFSDVNYGYTSGQNFSSYFSFGYEGKDPGLFGFPMHVAVDASNNIYVSDEENGRVQKFDRLGNFKEIYYTDPSTRAIAFLKNGNTVLTSIPRGMSYIKIRDVQKKIIKEWKAYEDEDSQYRNIEEITVDDEDNIYVVDGSANIIRKYDQNGNLLLKFQGAIRLPGQRDTAYPFGICYSNGKIFITSPRNGVIRVFDKKGNYIKSWDTGSNCYAIKAFRNHLYISCDNFIIKTDEGGEIIEKIGQGKISGQIPGLAVNSDEEIIVSEIYSKSIKVFKHL